MVLAGFVGGFGWFRVLVTTLSNVISCYVTLYELSGRLLFIEASF